MQKVCLWTPDKDLAQCVVGDRVVQVDRKAKVIRDAGAVQAKLGVEPVLIPDWLALVGDAADGYPGIPGIGRIGAARLLNRHGPTEMFPPDVLGDRMEQALLFKRLATLRTEAALFDDVEVLRWNGPRSSFKRELLTARLQVAKGVNHVVVDALMLSDVRLLRTVGDTLVLIGIELSTGGNRETGIRVTESVQIWRCTVIGPSQGRPPDAQPPAASPTTSERLLPV